MGNPAPAGTRVVVLDTALASLPIAEADLGIPWNWRIGPASRPVRLVRRTAMQTAVRMITTGVMLALLAGIAIKLKIFGGSP